MPGRGKLASVLVAGLLLAPALAQAQRPDWRAPHPTPPQRRPQQHEQPGVQDRVAQNEPGHAGNWLRRYKDLSPDQQRRALENDPQFRRLPPPRQARMLRQLRIFSSLPRQQQELILRRMEIWEHLTADQKREAREVGRQLHQLPPDRRQAVKEAIRRMGDLTPEQRDQLIDSEQFRSQFSAQERGLLHGAARLPLAPGDGL
jgi:Protein of unknown function (DUF3106)